MLHIEPLSSPPKTQVPASSARIPFYDVFMIRNFSGDSPLEGLSSFGLECQEMRCAPSPVTGRYTHKPAHNTHALEGLSSFGPE
jgi:hypothetical protein